MLTAVLRRVMTSSIQAPRLEGARLEDEVELADALAA